MFAQLGQIREREREKILKHYLVSPQFDTHRNLHSLWWCTSVDKVHVESEFDTAAYEVGHILR